MSTPDFVRRFRTVTAAATSRDGYQPDEMLRGWRQVVDGIRDGYDDTIDEYVFDLGVRGTIETVLRDPELARQPELTWFREHVAAIDDDLRAVLRDEPIPRLADFPWWESHPPRYAGSALAADYLTSYGVHVDVRAT